VQVAGITTQHLTDSLGNYTFDSLQIGSYFVTISKSGYVSHSDSIKIAKGSTSLLNRALAPTGGSGSGNITGWTLVPSFDGSQNLNGVCYAGGGVFYAVGDGSEVVRSTDGGSTWTNCSQTFQQLLDVVFSDKLHGIAVGLNGVTVTTDGGNSWSSSTINHNRYRSIAMVGQTVYIAGDDNASNGVVSESTDGGSNWQDLISGLTDVTYPEFAIAMSTPNDICVVGWYGDIGITDYGFDNWSNVAIAATRANLLSIAMPGLKDIFVVGDSGVIFHSQDSGAHWTKQNSGVVTSLRHVAFFDAKTGLAVGDSGVILLTKDGGTTWQSMSIPGNSFLSCAFEDASHAVVVGSGGVIYKSKIQ
jgi:photosystem II stability/assembly factor-like uncharacterized protein